MDQEVELTQLDRIEQKLDALNKVTIRNGGGRHITFELGEFNQMLYDKFKFKGALRLFSTWVGLFLSLLMIVHIWIDLKKS